MQSSLTHLRPDSALVMTLSSQMGRLISANFHKGAKQILVTNHPQRYNQLVMEILAGTFGVALLVVLQDYYQQCSPMLHNNTNQSITYISFNIQFHMHINFFYIVIHDIQIYFIGQHQIQTMNSREWIYSLSSFQEMDIFLCALNFRTASFHHFLLLFTGCVSRAYPQQRIGILFDASTYSILNLPISSSFFWVATCRPAIFC